jgi:pimeloyl-ACP methyl ester carboxylesterase
LTDAPGRTPLVLIHGFTDTARTWELVRPWLEERHDVVAVALPGHVGGPEIAEVVEGDVAVAEVERVMDARGWPTAHVAGNSLGGYVALQLAERGRARSVVAFAPAGGWAEGDASYREVLAHFPEMQAQVRPYAAQADALMQTDLGRRRATATTTVNYQHIPPDLLADQLRAAAQCTALVPMTELAQNHGWTLDPARIDCPLRFVWGTADVLLPWPRAAARYRAWFPTADWIELPDVGHAIQLDVPREAAQLILGVTSP